MKTIAMLAFSASAFAQTGHWEGKINAPRRELGIVVDLATNPPGTWIGSVTVVGSTSADVPLFDVSAAAPQVRFKAYLPELVSFAGVLSADGATISGSAANAEGETSFEISRKGEANVKIPPRSSALAEEFAGSWEGAISVQGRTLRLGLKLAAGADGTATGTFISLDRGNTEIPITTVTIDGKALRLESRPISGIYKGTLGPGGEISGEWTQGALTTPLTFKRSGK